MKWLKRLKKLNDTWNTQEWKEKAFTFVKDESCVWCGATEKLVPHHPKKRGGYTHDEYMDIDKYCRTKDGAKFILCTKCNFMENKHFKLCPKCKTHYYKPKRGRELLCSKCFLQTPFGQKAKAYYDQHPEELKRKRRSKTK